MFSWTALTFVIAVGHCCFARAGLKLQVCLPVVTKAETSGFLASAGISGPASYVWFKGQPDISRVHTELGVWPVKLFPFWDLPPPFSVTVITLSSNYSIQSGYRLLSECWLLCMTPGKTCPLEKTVIRKHRNWFVLVSSSKSRSLLFLSLGSLQCCGCFFQTSWSLTGDRWLDNSWQWLLCCATGSDSTGAVRRNRRKLLEPVMESYESRA